MGKRLRHQPHGETAELVGKQMQQIAIVEMLTDILVEVGALHPVHQQDGELLAICIGSVNEQLIVQILKLGEET